MKLFILRTNRATIAGPATSVVTLAKDSLAEAYAVAEEIHVSAQFGGGSFPSIQEVPPVEWLRTAALGIAEDKSLTSIDDIERAMRKAAGLARAVEYDQTDH